MKWCLLLSKHSCLGRIGDHSRDHLFSPNDQTRHLHQQHQGIAIEFEQAQDSTSSRCSAHMTRCTLLHKGTDSEEGGTVRRRAPVDNQVMQIWGQYWTLEEQCVK